MLPFVLEFGEGRWNTRKTQNTGSFRIKYIDEEDFVGIVLEYYMDIIIEF